MGRGRRWAGCVPHMSSEHGDEFVVSRPGFSDAEENARLERFGYEPAMERSTGRFASFAVAFAFVSIATGTFTTYGSVLNTSVRWGFGRGRSR